MFKLTTPTFIGLFGLISFQSFAQAPDWQHLDLQQDHVFGISTDKAYRELLKGKKAKPVVVAILDSGTDTSHRDLSSVLWNNPREKPANGRDDDHNGHIDDTHGWSFIGGAKGDVQYDNLELTRLIRRGDGKQRPELQTDFDNQRSQAQATVAGITRFRDVLDTIVHHINKQVPTLEDFRAYQPEGAAQAHVKSILLQQLQEGTYNNFRKQQLEEGLAHFREQADYQLNPEFDPRPVVGDDYNNSAETNYGNRNVFGPSALHGTHVAGIVGARRSDTSKVRGIADHVRLMIVRAVPDGDERDKDIANGIRYAADNGAKVINMSFGKPYSWDKPAVDAAAKYALSKDVLLIQAAGNSGENIDSTANFPTRVFADGSGTAGAWIVVGASGWQDDEHLAASFSNYGKTAVDVFAPGEQILSTVPGNAYVRENGTSMAAPVVTGLAALIREYYPKLSAMQVKEIILQSVSKVSHHVTINKNGQPVSVPFSDLCRTGGIVNAYEALRLAETYTKEKKST
ncbi:S8 family serine peptidase [Mucilaginibacter corticis]|uniref:S8 family serine peptidase n=1 Tax=Mucilaginibacter corticis TaxID=2597670 RepID=A0A556MIF5_9SPHI|nr:S8 family peptidase [Mucilaginibacter corticis]TSJ39696.1 S8 family serine peptidase [Mucilaginibacter corticis]